MKTLFEHDKAVIYFDPSINAIEVIWKKVQDEQTYRLIFTKGVEYLKEYKATSWLSDIRHQGVVGPAASAWLQKEIIPQAIKVGLKRIAVVVDSDVFKQFYVKNIGKSGVDQFMQNFASVDSAKAWLKENK